MLRRSQGNARVMPGEQQQGLSQESVKPYEEASDSHLSGMGASRFLNRKVMSLNKKYFIILLSVILKWRFREAQSLV